MLLVLVDREARADGRELEQHPARLKEIHGLEVEAVDHLRGVRAGLGDTLTPRRQVLRLAGERDVVDASRALSTVDLRRGRVVGVEAAPVLAADLPALPLRRSKPSPADSSRSLPAGLLL